MDNMLPEGSQWSGEMVNGVIGERPPEPQRARSRKSSATTLRLLEEWIPPRLETAERSMPRGRGAEAQVQPAGRRDTENGGGGGEETRGVDGAPVMLGTGVAARVLGILSCHWSWPLRAPGMVGRRAGRAGPARARRVEAAAGWRQQTGGWRLVAASSRDVQLFLSNSSPEWA